VSYNTLLGLKMIIDIDTLECNSQCSKSIHVLAIFKILSRHAKFFMISLRYLQGNLSGPEVELLLYLLIANKNLSLEKGSHRDMTLSEISSRIEVSNYWCWAMLNNLWRALLENLNFKARLTIVLDHFNCWKLILFDPIHKLLWPILPIQDFLYFFIKEFPFSYFYCLLEVLLIF